MPLQQGVERACSCQLATVKREISSSRAGNFAMYGVVRRPIGRDLVLIDMEAHLVVDVIGAGCRFNGLSQATIARVGEDRTAEEPRRSGHGLHLIHHPAHRRLEARP